jgi:hypothetical protein
MYLLNISTRRLRYNIVPEYYLLVVHWRQCGFLCFDDQSCTFILSVIYHEYIYLVWATHPGKLLAVRVWTRKMVWFGSKAVQKPDLLCLGRVVIRTGHKPVVFLDLFIVLQSLIFMNSEHELQWSIWVVIVLQYDIVRGCPLAAIMVLALIIWIHVMELLSVWSCDMHNNFPRCATKTSPISFSGDI